METIAKQGLARLDATHEVYMPVPRVLFLPIPLRFLRETSPAPGANVVLQSPARRLREAASGGAAIGKHNRVEMGESIVSQSQYNVCVPIHIRETLVCAGLGCDRNFSTTRAPGHSRQP